MNQLFSNRTPHQQQDGNSNIGQLLSLLKATSPDQAKSQVEQLIKERGISQQELKMYQQKAENLAKILGIK